MSVCSASASFIPTICPGFRPCNPNGIVLGDNVTIDLCVENESIEPGAGLPPYPRVAAEIQAYSSVEVMMMCRDSSCILPQLSDTLTHISSQRRRCERDLHARQQHLWDFRRSKVSSPGYVWNHQDVGRSCAAGGRPAVHWHDPRVSDRPSRWQQQRALLHPCGDWGRCPSDHRPKLPPGHHWWRSRLDRRAIPDTAAPIAAAAVATAANTAATVAAAAIAAAIAAS